MLTKVSSNPTLTTSWTYMLDGATDTASDSAGSTINYGYDTAGRRITETQTIPGLTGAKTVTSTLDKSNNRTRLTWADGYAADYGYDTLNRMTTVTEHTGGAALAAYAYDPRSRRTSTSFAGGTSSMAYTYSPGGDLWTLTDDLNGTANDVVYTDTYTIAHQLASEAVSNSAYVYSGPVTGTKAYTANTLNQYSAWDGTALAYDPKGNYLGTAAFPVFTYDAENRLRRAVAPSATDNAYTFDANGRRIAKAVTTVSAPVWGTPNWNAFTWTAAASAVRTSFIHDGDNEIAEYDNAGALIRRFVPGPAINEYAAMVTSGGTKTFPLLNRQGSLIATTDTSGARVEGPFVYDPHGNCYASGSACATLAATTFPFKFVGMRFDPESGTYYVRARNYTPLFGRFLQVDPVGYKDDYNLYTYVANDPTDKTDPSGKVTVTVGINYGFGLGDFVDSPIKGTTAEVGVAISLPIPGIDWHSAHADLGVYDTHGLVVGGGGVMAGETGGIATGSVQDISTRGDVSSQAAFAVGPIGGSVDTTTGKPGAGFDAKVLNPRNLVRTAKSVMAHGIRGFHVKGFHFKGGGGAFIGVTQTRSESFSLRDLVQWLRSK